MRRTALDRKLERMELEHLRRHVVALQAQLDEARERADHAESLAEHWWREVEWLRESLPETQCIALHRDGRLSIERRAG